MLEANDVDPELAVDETVLDRLLAPEFALLRLRRLESSNARSRLLSRNRGRIFGGLGV